MGLKIIRMGTMEYKIGRPPKTRGHQLQVGDKFTIEGWGTSARGHQVCNGRSVKTGRKMKVKTPQVFAVTELPNYPAQPPAAEPHENQGSRGGSAAAQS